MPTDHEALGQENAATAARVRSRRRATSNSREGLGLASQGTLTAEQGHGARSQRWQDSQTLTTCVDQAWKPLETRLHRRERCPGGRGASVSDSAPKKKKEHSQPQADRKQPSVVSRCPRHSAPNKIVETPGATERQVPTLQSNPQAPTDQTVLKAWKLSSRSPSTWTSGSLFRRKGSPDSEDRGDSSVAVDCREGRYHC